MGRKGAFKDRPLWRRLQTIHHEIKDGRYPNASTLAAKLDVSTKTVQRDLDYLRDELEAPIEFDRVENGYFYSRADYVLPFLPVDGNDLFSIGVAAQVLSLFGGTPLARDLQACYQRLAELMPPTVRLRPEIVMEKLALRAAAFRPVREEIWQAVSESLQKGIALSIRYRSAGAAAGEARTVLPYAFVLSGRDWMVLAQDRAVDQVKSFYLARIEDAKLSGERFAIPAGLRRRHVFPQHVRSLHRRREAVSLPRAVLPARSPTRCGNCNGIHGRRSKAAPDGSAILELPAQSVREARRFVLAYGKDALVLEPGELVEDLREETSRLARAYASQAGPTRRAAHRREGTSRHP